MPLSGYKHHPQPGFQPVQSYTDMKVVRLDSHCRGSTWLLWGSQWFQTCRWGSSTRWPEDCWWQRSAPGQSCPLPSSGNLPTAETQTHTHVQAVCLNPRMTLGIFIYSESLCRLTERTEYRYEALCCGCPLYWTMAFRWGSWSFTCQEGQSGRDVISGFFFSLSLSLRFLWTHWLLELLTCRIFDSWAWFSTTRMLASQFAAT